MSEYVFLAHCGMSLGHSTSVLVAADSAGNTRELSLAAVAELRTPVVTFNAQVVVDLLRQQSRTLPNQLVDIGDALKLLSGISRDDGGEPCWNVWLALEPFVKTPSDLIRFVSLIEARAPYPETNALLRLLATIAGALRELWIATEHSLRTCGEYERFTQIEIPEVLAKLRAVAQAGWNQGKKEVEGAGRAAVTWCRQTTMMPNRTNPSYAA